MITNNGRALCFITDYYPGLVTEQQTIPTWSPRYILCRTDGVPATIERHTQNQPKEMNFNYLAQNMEVVVGRGLIDPEEGETDVALATDIALKSEITDTNLVTIYSSSRNAHNCNGDYNIPISLHATKTYFNVGDTSIVIKEIGLITKDGFGYSYLLIRNALEENDWITIAPNETKTITITID